MDMMLFLLLPTSFAFVYGVNLENLVLVIGWYLISGPQYMGSPAVVSLCELP